jgi:phage terminase small subunit
MALTPKQEKFCQNIVSGMSGKDSYLSAYDTKCSEQVAYNEASKLLLREDIQKRIFDIRKPLEQAAQIKALNAREQQIKAIQERIELCKKKDDEQSLIRYYDMLNKIYALYKETETEVKPESTVNNLDINVLKRLSGVS